MDTKLDTTKIVYLYIKIIPKITALLSIIF